MAKTILYPIKTEPVPLGAKETITLDKWQFDSLLPFRPRRQALRATTPFVPQIAPDTSAVYVAGSSCDPIAVKNFQYEDVAAPLVPIITTTEPFISADWPDIPYLTSFQYDERVQPIFTPAPVEEVTLDKWFQELQRPTFPTRRTAQFQELFIDALSFSPRVMAVYVSGSNPDPIVVKWFQFDDGVAPINVTAAPPETITLDKWFRELQRPIFKQKRLQSYGVNTAVAEEVIYVEALQFWPDSPYLRIGRRSQGLYTPVLSPLTQVGETVFPDKWHPAIQQPRMDLRRLQRLFPNFTADTQLFNPITGEVVTLDKWNRNYPDILFRNKRLPDYGQFSIDPSFLLQGERISLDKWHPLTQQSRMDLKRQQGLYPSLAIDSQFYLVPPIEVIRVDKWGRNYPDYLFRLKRLPDYGQWSSDGVPRGETIFADKWHPAIQQPRFDLKRQQWMFPSLAIDSQFYLVPPAEIIRVDKWGRNYPDYLFRLKRLPDYGQFSKDLLSRSETITIDKWLQAVANPRLKARSVVHLLPQGGLNLNFSAALPFLRFMENATPIYKTRNRAVYTVNGLLIVVTPTGATIMDKEGALFRMVFSGLFNNVN